MRAFILLCTLLVGCETVAQQQQAQINNSVQESNRDLSACLAEINADPKYLELWQHLPRDFSLASFDQMTNTAYASPHEAELLSNRRQRALPCRNAQLAKQSATVPGYVAVESEAYFNFDNNLLELVQRKITWGEFITRSRLLLADTDQKMRKANQAINAGLAVSHQQEIAQRQAAFEAYQRSTYERQVLQNQQQILLNQQQNQFQGFGQRQPPVTTNCNRVGNSINCQSY